MLPDPSHFSYFRSKILHKKFEMIRIEPCIGGGVIYEYNIFDYHKRANMIFIISGNGSQVSYRIFTYNKRSNMIHMINYNSRLNILKTTLQVDH